MAEQNSNPTSTANPVVQYLTEVRGEVRKVTWPTRPEAWRWTGIVMLIMLFMTILLASFDFLFSSGLRILIDAFLGVAG